MSNKWDELNLLKTCRRIFLSGIERRVSVGIHDFERESKQRILLDVQLFVPLLHSTPIHDLLEEVVDYDFVRRTIDQVLTRGHFNLQETICDQIASALFLRPEVVALSVSSRKPDVYQDCDAVGVEIWRIRDDYFGQSVLAP